MKKHLMTTDNASALHPALIIKLVMCASHPGSLVCYFWNCMVGTQVLSELTSYWQ